MTSPVLIAVSGTAYLAAMMVRTGRADAMVAGIRSRYADVIRPALQVIGPAPGITRVATMHLSLIHI